MKKTKCRHLWTDDSTDGETNDTCIFCGKSRYNTERGLDNDI